MCAVARPVALARSASVCSASGSAFTQSAGGRSLALGASWPAIQSVILSRAGYLPVKSAARVGEHTVHAE